MKNEDIKPKHALYLAIGVVAMFLGLLLLTRPERKAIAAEKERLENVEKIVVDAIAQDNFNKAKVYLIQLRWQYDASTVGGKSETDDLRQVWHNKRIEYFRLIGEDPNDFIHEEQRESKGLKEQFRDVIGD